MNQAKQYAELRAITMFYQFKSMDTSAVYRKKKTKKAKLENDRVYNLYIENLKKLELIQESKKDDDRFWDEVEVYSYKHKNELINAGITFNIN